ncbi:MAG: DNA-3-methyladenine glycosylase I [Pseudomonadota bacterium]
MALSGRQPKRCGWCGEDPIYVDYHDSEWGVPMTQSRELFALLQLEGMQAGLSWITVLKKRAHMRKRFFRFSPNQLAARGRDAYDSWLEDPGLIRNRAKLSALIGNAEAFLAYEKRHGRGSFGAFIWSFVDGKPQQNRFKTLAEVPAETDASRAMSKALKAAGFRFVGPTICYAFMQSAGLVNDHITSCFRAKACRSFAAEIG